ncbi:hypothetical protein [Curtobacterium oceanosedimentum]|uniref:hypothetical protein n=1 Tax=Curtobacterium oceanosedimentum TaxID=465820 RepID=UPI001CE05500|nr:hypothetical protein [Curtobacterium oceanosedimentum]MCA5922554.1 hypothetical protein [Curtobacterium oceanosedimentum]
MGDLQVDTSTLDALTHALTPVPQAVRLDRAFSDPREDALGSAEVAAALGSAGSTVSDRAEVLAQSLTAIGQYPSEVAAQISAVEDDLAGRSGGR